jgi:cellobiose-specific phosphotransferase system component IIB
MVSSVSGGSASGLMAALMKEAAAKQTLEVSVIKKGQEIEKMQGDSALKLIDAAANVSESGKIDVRV